VPTLLDTGIVYACYDSSDGWHERALELVDRERAALLLPALVIPEADHLLGVRLGREARQVFYEGIIGGSYLVVDLAADDYSRAAEIDRHHADLELGLVDSAVLTLAERLRATIATTDRRDFEPAAARMDLVLVP
jgi:predicted nucleic acid-binding protein